MQKKFQWMLMQVHYWGRTINFFLLFFYSFIQKKGLNENRNFIDFYELVEKGNKQIKARSFHELMILGQLSKLSVKQSNILDFGTIVIGNFKQ